MRRRMSFVAAAVGVALALPGVSVAQAPPAQDSVFGTEITTPTVSNGAINMTSGPSGEAPTGVASGVLLGVTYVSTSVECLSVSGNSATFVIALASNSLGINFGKATVVDNSSAGFPDTLALTGHGFEPDCVPDPETPGVPLIAGDIVVVDAQPLPTSKEQCRNGGYAQLGFKNEGRCVAFVNRGAKP